MATFVMIAGAWHGSWCWNQVVPLLQAAGHLVLTPDLLGTGDSQAPLPDDPLGSWSDQVAELIRTEADPVVLVGHSPGGLVISKVAELVPEKIDLLIYLAAFLLRDGQTLASIAQHADNAGPFAAAITIKDGALGFADDAVQRFLYNETADDLVQVARARLRPEPAAAFTTPVHVSEQRFATVPRAYIECANDRAIPLATQRSMQAELPCRVTERLDSDHSPFFSMPANLAQALRRCLLISPPTREASGGSTRFLVPGGPAGACGA